MYNKKEILWEELDLFQSEHEEFEDEDEDCSDSYEEGSHNGKPTSFNIKKLVQTPIGHFILDDAYHPLRGLPVMIAHVNFPITQEILESLDSVVGIEAFKQVGRYRLLFIFGKLFDIEVVVSDIEDSMDVDSSSNGVIDIDIDDFGDDVKKVIKSLSMKLNSPHWLAYIFPNGKYIYENLDSEQQVLDKHPEYTQLSDMSSGIALTSIKSE